MKIILLENVRKVGQKGQLVTVADGYAMNVLIPQKKAVPGTAENLKRHERGVAAAANKADQSAMKAKEILAEIAGKTLTIVAKAGTTGTLFKSIHASDIAAEIKKQWGMELPTNAVKLDHPLKQKGTHEVPVELLGSKANIVVAI